MTNKDIKQTESNAPEAENLTDEQLEDVQGAGPFDQAGAGLGHSLSGVKVHAGSSAKDAAKSTGAKAMPTGNDVAFGSTQSSGGDVAHEVTDLLENSDNEDNSD